MGEVYEVGLCSDGKTYIPEDSMKALERMMWDKNIPDDEIRKFCDKLSNYKFYP